ncbi:MAG: alpha/beta hydrolase [Myxococcota bacterium]
MSAGLFHQDNAANREVLRACPTLMRGFRPKAWVRNPHVQIGLLVRGERRAAPVAWDREERLTMADGGTVSLQWLGSGDGATAPVVLVMPTITGDGDDLSDLVTLIRRELGWTVVVCNRRGHAGVPLTTPRFNTMGNVGDLREQIAHVQTERPNAPLFALGTSAGSGVLARYLGETPDTPLAAGALYCPGYDLTDLFDHAHAVYSRIMVGRLKRHFLEPNAALLSDRPGYAECAAAKDLGSFHRHAHGLAGFGSRDEYLRASNPMEVAYDIAIPVLTINAADDPICNVRMVERVRKRLIGSLRNGLLAVTRHGSHCAHLPGRTRRSWAHEVLVEYLRAQGRRVGVAQRVG